MKKAEIREGINLIKNAIKVARDNIDEILNDYNNIKEHLESIQEIQEETGIDTGIDFETVLNDTIRSCIENNGDMEEVASSVGDLIYNLECWQEDVSENKQEQIQEQYLDILNDVRDTFDIYSIECGEDLDTQLFDMLSALEEMEI